MAGRILVTGAAGYIGSHCVKALLARGDRVVGLDNLDRGARGALGVLDRLAGDGGDFVFVEGNVADEALVRELLRAHEVRDVIHFAALAYVGESVYEPLRYYVNNTAGSLRFLDTCVAEGVERFVFSSTCATYGEPDPSLIPIDESCPQLPVNPYGESKLAVERALRDTVHALDLEGRDLSVAILRYFNVAGCDPDGDLGEDHDPETHLIPIVLQAALGMRDHVTIFGEDYDTPDGTCVRDYIHVSDLVDAHLLAHGAMRPRAVTTYNLGLGRGFSVREIIEAVRRVTGAKMEVRTGERRPGDPPTLAADATRARRELGWTPRYEALDEIIATAWHWFTRHPRGYASGEAKG
jgi:UDP-glucose 4-epimerase